MVGSRRAAEIARVVLIGLAVIWSVAPLYWMYATSLKPPALTWQLPPALLYPPYLDYYVQVFTNTPFWPYLVNTLIVAVTTTVISLTVGSFAAYGFTRFRFPGSDVLPLFYLVVRMLPRFVLVIPLYIVMRELGLLNTRQALIIAYTTFSLPFVIWMMIGFFKEIPIELEEAAMVDGCNRFHVLWRVVLPLAAPGLAATSIFAFLLGWNEFLFSLVLAGRDSRTLPNIATSFTSDRGVEWGLVMATGSLVLLPVIALALLVQKHIVRGMTLGAVKG
jgi:multiple sugar transport system permease protein